MAWRFRAHMIETCSCNMLCPCWFGVQELMVMDQGYCTGANALRIQEGESDGVSLAGRTVVLAPYFPGPTLFDGNGTARLYFDDGTRPEQARELEAIFQGKRGGPMEALSPLISKWLPTQTAKIDIAEEGDAITITVGDAGRVESRAVRDAEGNGFTLQGGGFVAAFRMDEAELAPSSSRWSDPEMPRAFETKSGARGMVTWSG